MNDLSKRVGLEPWSIETLWRSRHGTFDQLVEFAAIMPHAPAFRAVVDLDALAIGHHRSGVSAVRTFHDVPQSMLLPKPISASRLLNRL